MRLLIKQEHAVYYLKDNVTKDQNKDANIRNIIIDNDKIKQYKNINLNLSKDN
jgi:hypothetical protein